MTATDRWRRLDTLFARAIELDEAALAALLEEVEAEDPELLRELEAMLDSHVDNQDGFLEPVAGAELVATLPERIGRYNIRRRINAGAMGVVYEAVQTHPRRSVAIKVLRSGFVGESARRRFRHEAQILARLRHPSIAHVYDAGTHDDGAGGVPYFVMEYVQGAQPITRFAREQALDLPARLALFRQVCDAVAYGHQRSIVHRDLKPDNVLVDSSGRVKIIDFGVARTVDSDLALATMQTTVGQLIGTPQYMSPEQCAGDGREIDERSDVYSLGVILFELLTNHLPYTVDTANLLDFPRVIRDTPPDRLRRHDRTLPRDLERIVATALAKVPAHRYQTVVAFVEDLRRFELGEPIQAQRASMAYRIRTFLTRHTGPLVGVVSVLVILALLLAGDRVVIALGVSVAALTGLTIIVFRVRSAETTSRHAANTAQRQRMLAEAARDAEAEQRSIAQHQAVVLNSVNSFLNDDILAAARPDELGRHATVLDVIRHAATKLDRQFTVEPLVEAAIRYTLGDTFLILDELGDAEAHLRAALHIRREELGDAHRDTLHCMGSLALLCSRRDQLDEAQMWYQKSLTLRRETLGEDDPDTIASLNNVAAFYRRVGRLDEAESLIIEAIERAERIIGPDALPTITCRKNLAFLRCDQERHDDALALFRTLLAIVAQQEARGQQWRRMKGLLLTGSGECLVATARAAEAVDVLTSATEVLDEALGAHHRETQAAQRALAAANGHA